MVCGKEDVDLIDRMCSDCYVQRRNPANLPKVIEGKICKLCYSEWINGRWERGAESEDEAVNDVILHELAKSIKVDPNIKNFRIEPGERWMDRGGRSYVRINMEGMIGNKTINFSQDVELKVIKVICESCIRKRGKYYEAIIQLRGKEKFSQEKRVLFESFFSRDAAEAVSDVVESKDGIDYYFINKTVAKRLVSSFTSMVKAEVVQSFEKERLKDGKRDAKLVISLRV
ncbi:hypothetical protein CM19_02465 [Candidatus Acidianus copahuensis]|uniref:Nmd3 N-terminal domain-containing protein n=1 Tax=Candidatus Acidianus copahuensis TaxID=1160895 RepID=A0A031LTN3_9CREN|nr:hypothetical protein CM19_02465 [Candidatus Acidianus copahuensis]